MRNERLASAAWVIFVLKQGHAKMVGNGALLLEQVDSYRAEIIAVKEGLHHANSILADIESSAGQCLGTHSPLQRADMNSRTWSVTSRCSREDRQFEEALGEDRPG